MEGTDPAARLRPRRAITGMSAILLPFADDGSVDWSALAAHVERTAAAGLTPAVNMDTGYVQLLDDTTRLAVLAVARDHAGSRGFVAGACPVDVPGTAWAPEPHHRAMAEIVEHGGVPVVFPSHALNGLEPDAWVAAHDQLAAAVDRMIAFELGSMFVPYGRIYPLDAYEALLGIRQIVGAKHSSLSRRAEWDRLAVRDRVRPDFLVLTGNDLAIDMVMYGSDYLLGLSTFAPDLFAERDARWAAGDPGFYELNDVLQYLGFFAFRAPVPAYKHDAAMFLHLRGWVATDRTHPGAPTRPEADREVLAEIADRLGVRA